jgi:hypothetical protein
LRETFNTRPLLHATATALQKKLAAPDGAGGAAALQLLPGTHIWQLGSISWQGVTVALDHVAASAAVTLAGPSLTAALSAINPAGAPSRPACMQQTHGVLMR